MQLSLLYKGNEFRSILVFVFSIYTNRKSSGMNESAHVTKYFVPFFHHLKIPVRFFLSQYPFHSLEINPRRSCDYYLLKISKTGQGNCFDLQRQHLIVRVQNDLVIEGKKEKNIISSHRSGSATSAVNDEYVTYNPNRVATLSIFQGIW